VDWVEAISASIEAISAKTRDESKPAKWHSRLFEISRVFVCFNHLAIRIVNANHSIM
jgi:hypothetical protein